MKQRENIFSQRYLHTIWCADIALLIMSEGLWSNGGMIQTGENWSTLRKLYKASVVGEWMSMGHWWNDTDRGNWSTGRENCPSATLSTTNSIWTGLPMISGALHSESSSWLHGSSNWLFNSLIPLLVSLWIFKWRNKCNSKGETYEVVQEIFSLLKTSRFFLFRFRQTSAQMKQGNQ
jgi:hypothetical protein